VSISAGAFHTCGVKQDGTAWCWGFNTSGALGTPELEDSLVPVQVAGLDGVADISAGGFHTCALAESGAVWCWGGNSWGQLGNGTFDHSPSPVDALMDGPATHLSASRGGHTCAVQEAVAIWCWGYNNFGRLGDGTNDNQNLPVPVAPLL
jgi:alpha-tubulin suppressor-like RCC1 family protein